MYIGDILNQKCRKKCYRLEKKMGLGHVEFFSPFAIPASGTSYETEDAAVNREKFMLNVQ